MVLKSFLRFTMVLKSFALVLINFLLYFSELSALITPLSAPPYNDSLLLRGLPALYTRLSS
jgi:hypothetical protein